MPPADIDAYLAALTTEQADAVSAVRRLVHDTVPGATEAISYGIPTFRLRDQAFVHVAAWTTYLSTYPVPTSDDPELAAAIARHHAGKGTLRFGYAEPLPLDLIGRVVALLAEQRTDRA